mmetsp:Transcript_55045/g.103153  ORF Transcript_55045/g.103153 Transcript_55045/m.103153 type:complete len:283 (-) Transcript_55045:18-866(-)
MPVRGQTVRWVTGHGLALDLRIRSPHALVVASTAVRVLPNVHLHLPKKLIPLLALDLQVHGPTVFVPAPPSEVCPPGTKEVVTGHPNYELIPPGVVVDSLVGIACVTVTLHFMRHQHAPVCGLRGPDVDRLNHVVHASARWLTLQHQVQPPIIPATPAVEHLRTHAVPLPGDLELVVVIVEAKAIAWISRVGGAVHRLGRHPTLRAMVPNSQWHQHADARLSVVHLTGDFQLHAPGLVPEGGPRLPSSRTCRPRSRPKPGWQGGPPGPGRKLHAACGERPNL